MHPYPFMCSLMREVLLQPLASPAVVVTRQGLQAGIRLLYLAELCRQHILSILDLWFVFITM